MAAYIKTLRDNSGDQILPRTSTRAIFTESGYTLEQQLTEIEDNSIPVTHKGTPGGVASLDESGKIPTEQLPQISSVNVYAATIGMVWTEDENTGVKYQTVAISEITADNTAKVDHSNASIDGTSDGYAVFVEEENQYLTYITNGYAETVEGGVTFHIFGDAPTVAIPIIVEVV